MSPYPSTPRTSHIRSSSQVARVQQQQQQQQHPAQDAPETRLSAPASQESFVSAQSAGSSNAPRLQSSSSNVSQLTNYSELTSPISTAPSAYERHYVTTQPDMTRRRTPEDTLRGTNGFEDSALASPIGLTSPASTNGAKRTASGHVKNAPSLPNTPLTAAYTGHRSRTDSISSTGSRAGELAANLKTRLGYAMHKVHNGWEHNNISEVEKLAAFKARGNRHSMSHLDYSARPASSGLSNGTERLSMYESSLNGTRSPPPKRHSGLYMPSSSQPTAAAPPRLQPAADIRPQHPQHRHYHTAPSSQTNIMSPPRTPNRRPPTLRTDTQTAEAERDALQALFQLGSPHTSQASRQFASQASSSQASPLRSEFAATPRRVTFARSESESEGSVAQRSSDEGNGPDRC